MKWSRLFSLNQSIQTKLFVIILGVSFLTMFISTTLGSGSNYLAMRLETEKRLNETTDFISQGILKYSDKGDYQKLDMFFDSFEMERFLDKACYYTQGYLVVSYLKKSQERNGFSDLCPAVFSEKALISTNSYLRIGQVVPVERNHTVLGHLYVLYDLDKNVAFFAREMLINTIAIGFGLIFAYVIGFRLYGFIIQPIFHLSGLATKLSKQADYSMRAKKFADDELGVLSDAFNNMIVGLGETNRELELARKEADEANKQKSSFLAMMSHEIRTPINGIIGTTDLLLETSMTGRQKEYVSIIDKSAQTLFELINDILDFSKIEADKLELENIAFDITQHIQDVIDILQVTVSQKGLPLFFKNNLKGHYYVMGDPVRIKQIVINLVSNAVKFTEKGSVTITLDGDLQADQNIKQIWISVEDTGIGIPEDRQKTVFDDFSQADSTTTRKYGGTGLGLTICKRLVEAMNGTIGLKSEEGVGSTFWLSLPMEIVPEPSKAKIITPKTQAPHDSNNIMFVEDNETNIMITSAMLTQAGFDPVLCRNGEEAVEAYKNNPIPLILMDCQMPVMDGWKATQKIRDYEKEQNMSPAVIVALTANAMQGDREKCIEAGMDDYLAKPFKKKELLEKLEEVQGVI